MIKEDHDLSNGSRLTVRQTAGQNKFFRSMCVSRLMRNPVNFRIDGRCGLPFDNSGSELSGNKTSSEEGFMPFVKFSGIVGRFLYILFKEPEKRNICIFLYKVHSYSTVHKNSSAIPKSGARTVGSTETEIGENFPFLSPECPTSRCRSRGFELSTRP